MKKVETMQEVACSCRARILHHLISEANVWPIARGQQDGNSRIGQQRPTQSTHKLKGIERRDQVDVIIASEL
jgi:hypothetical protein